MRGDIMDVIEERNHILRYFEQIDRQMPSTDKLVAEAIASVPGLDETMGCQAVRDLADDGLLALSGTPQNIVVSMTLARITNKGRAIFNSPADDNKHCRVLAYIAEHGATLPYGMDMAPHDLNLTSAEVARAIYSLVEDGYITHDEEGGSLWLVQIT